ncbi:MAG: CBS domain-containing protein [Pseudomonadota bacterium]
MLKARDIMSKNVVCVSPETEITQAAKLLLERHLNGLPVLDQKGLLVGIICQSDLVFQQKKIPLPSVFTLLDSLIPLSSSQQIEAEVEKIAAITVEQAMTPDPVFVGPEATIEDIATMMVRKKIHSLPVVENGRLAGMVGKEDIIRTLIPRAKE